MRVPPRDEVEDTRDGWTAIPEDFVPLEMFKPGDGNHTPPQPGEVLSTQAEVRAARNPWDHSDEDIAEAVKIARMRVEAQRVVDAVASMPKSMYGTPRHPNSQRFHDILVELGDLHDKKQADYGRGDDPFANVRGSEEWGIRGWVGSMVRATDKVKRLQQYARTGTLVNEGVADAFMDLAVYAIIAMVLWEQDQA